MPKDLRDELKGFLSIDKNALDECLMEQPEIYSRVAEAVANSEAERDASQLDLDELTAELDKETRSNAAKAEEKLTDAAVKQRLAAMPKIQDLSRVLLDKKKDAKLWRALEKSFEQRADMLKKLVDLHLRSAYGYALEAGVGQQRGQLAEGNRAAANELRRKKLP